MRLRNSNKVNSKDIASDLKFLDKWSLSFWIRIPSSSTWIMRVTPNFEEKQLRNFLFVANKRIVLNFQATEWTSSKLNLDYYSVHVISIPRQCKK